MFLLVVLFVCFAWFEEDDERDGNEGGIRTEDGDVDGEGCELMGRSCSTVSFSIEASRSRLSIGNKLRASSSEISALGC